MRRQSFRVRRELFIVRRRCVAVRGRCLAVRRAPVKALRALIIVLYWLFLLNLGLDDVKRAIKGTRAKAFAMTGVLMTVVPLSLRVVRRPVR
jgi:hypothetical protein